jgi:hypothetical protein
VNAVLDRFAAVGQKFSRLRRRDEQDDKRSDAGPPPSRAALENLRDVTLKSLGSRTRG